MLGARMPTLAETIDAFLAYTFRESPTAATFAGYPGHDSELPDLSAAAHAARDAADDEFAASFAAFDGLGPDEAIDRDLVLSELAGRRIVRDRASWRRLPDAYLGAGLMGCFSLFLRRPAPEAELAEAAAERLRGVSTLVDQMTENLDAELAAANLLRRGAGQARAGAAYARDLLPAEVGDGPARATVAEAGAGAAGAYERAAAWLDDLATRATGSFAVGEERYSRLLRDRELLGFDATGLRALGEAQVTELAEEMTAVAEKSFATTDFRAVLDRLAEDRPDDPDAMRAGYELATAEARAFLVERELVTFPEGERCDVLPSPVFQRPVLAVASYFSPPAFGDDLTGIFNVPYPPEGTTEEQLAQRLADNNFATMPTVSVHEVYPGHHWHFTRLQIDAAPLRRVLTTSYFVEGWALYVERMMLEEGFFTNPGHVLAHLDARLFRAARIVVDTGLHCFGMPFGEAVDYMRSVAGLTEAVATDEVTRYTAWPTQAASYLTGSLEIERIRRRWFDEDRGSLRAFHDRIAGTGGLPIALAERATLG